MQDKRFNTLVAAATVFCIAGIMSQSGNSSSQPATAAPTASYQVEADLVFPKSLAREVALTTINKTAEQVGSISITQALSIVRDPAHHTLADMCKARRLAFGLFMMKWDTVGKDQQAAVVKMAADDNGVDLATTCSTALKDE